MSQRPINPGGGDAPAVMTRRDTADLARLVRLARRRRVSRSQMTRELLCLALDAIEAAGRAPPDPGGG
jgi:hypothetical protein